MLVVLKTHPIVVRLTQQREMDFFDFRDEMVRGPLKSFSHFIMLHTIAHTQDNTPPKKGEEHTGNGKPGHQDFSGINGPVKESAI